MNHIDSVDPGYDMVKMFLYLCGLPSKNQQPQSNHKKNIRKKKTNFS